MSSPLKTMVDKALNELDQKRIEYMNKVQELEDICNQFEKEAYRLKNINEEQELLLKQIKAKILDGKIDDAIELLEKYQMIRKYKDESQMPPPWYGVAWYQPEYRWRAVCYPIPFNILAAWIRGFYIFLKWGSMRLHYKFEAWDHAVQMEKKK